MPAEGAASRPQRVPDADRDILIYLIRIAGTLGELLGDGLAGLYVHGSLAAGTFRRSRSDLNLIGVVDGSLEPSEREAAARTLMRLSDGRPLWGDIDISILQAHHARNFTMPMPVEVRYAKERHEAIRRSQVDYAVPEESVLLASSIVDLRNAGIALVGPPVETVFGPVPWYAYMEALAIYLQRSDRDVTHDPGIAVLAACRVLHGATARGISLADKEWAARFALESSPLQYHGILNDALALYRGIKTPDDVVLDAGTAREFISYVRTRTGAIFERASGQ